MLKKTLLLASLLGLLAGCAPGTSPTPAVNPGDSLMTAVALTSQAAIATSQAQTQTAAPPATTQPTVTPVLPTAFPTATFTPVPGVPLAQIQFLAPGPMSRLVSSVQMKLLIVAGDSDVVQISLLGEDGRILHRMVNRIERKLSGTYAAYKVPFEIRALSETALLQVSTRDKEGRMQALNTVQLILLSTGITEINPPGNLIYERAVIYTPESSESVSGGTLTVAGRYWPIIEQPLFVELILPDGTITATRVITLTGMDTQEFSTTIPYSVTEPTYARLTVRQEDPRLQIPLYVYTRLVLLNP